MNKLLDGVVTGNLIISFHASVHFQIFCAFQIFYNAQNFYNALIWKSVQGNRSALREEVSLLQGVKGVLLMQRWESTGELGPAEAPGKGRAMQVHSVFKG